MLKQLLPDAERHGNPVRQWWDRLRDMPGGPRIFSAAVGRMAPYTGSMGAQVLELSPGHARVALRDRRAVRNHLRCVHAIALCNLAELTGNLVVAYGLPDNGRFIVAGLSIEYLKKARGNLLGTCEITLPPLDVRREIEVPVQIFNQAGELVTRASLRTLIGPKKKPA